MIAADTGTAVAATLTLQSLPLFPLSAVLFPDGLLSLRVFEVRYLDMIARAKRHVYIEGQYFASGRVAADAIAEADLPQLRAVKNRFGSTDEVGVFDVPGFFE